MVRRLDPERRRHPDSAVRGPEDAGRDRAALSSSSEGRQSGGKANGWTGRARRDGNKPKRTADGGVGELGTGFWGGAVCSMGFERKRVQSWDPLDVVS